MRPTLRPIDQDAKFKYKVQKDETFLIKRAICQKEGYAMGLRPELDHTRYDLGSCRHENMLKPSSSHYQASCKGLLIFKMNQLRLRWMARKRGLRTTSYGSVEMRVDVMRNGNLIALELATHGTLSCVNC